ncbi:electron transfer flavoprotein alpha subunit apoprotein [Kushneria avicenniae]|uniref:Electron transfer flavoprotein alpha subunit apoprotein n=1 Tax=Kushneria avicenniae TaxID=402385 RepID=A0A1I1LER2_9GAMM|nr:electron transfer flavoprotein subunit alpha/FixB family protein [Kushneria avicenniae]SFC71509.1 electron transfer flavoprotein alpha subunit apoprotein [Kushneria avicenniae]
MSELVRRDPRKEWIARNRLHPQHLEVLAEIGGGSVASEWMGPNGLMRRNPHAVGFMGPNGIRRIDRSGAQQASQATGRSAEAKDSRRRVTIENPAFTIAVVPDMAGGRLSGHDRDLLGLARQLADADPENPGAVLAIVYGEHKETTFDEAGIDRMLMLEGDQFDGYTPENRIAALQGVDREVSPRFWMLPDSTQGGGELGRRLSVRLGERAATQVWQVEAHSDSATGWRCTTRGAAGTTDIVRDLPRVVIALAECADPITETRHAAEAIELSQPLPNVLGRIEDIGEVAVDPASVSLAEAEFILSAGNGVKDWDNYHHAAEVLGATKGASRVAVDDGYMPRDRQVGATGTWVSAKVYVAVGISGAIQHLQGIQTCEKVVAINLDEGCDMVKRADLAVIGDANAILSALVERVEQYRAEQEESRNAA